MVGVDDKGAATLGGREFGRHHCESEKHSVSFAYFRYRIMDVLSSLEKTKGAIANTGFGQFEVGICRNLFEDLINYDLKFVEYSVMNGTMVFDGRH